MSEELIESLNNPKPKLNIYQDKYKGWVWEVELSFNVIGKSSKPYLNREDCISDIILLGEKIKELRENGDIF